VGLWWWFGGGICRAAAIGENLTQIADIRQPERRADFMLDRKRSKTEERSFALMLDDLESEEIAFEISRRSRSLVPPGWNPAGNRAGIKPQKTKLNLSLDADMVKWFRGLGRGYQPRMNAVLRAYMHAMIAKEIERAGDRDCKREVI
jgi:uncharacterized protein (DUF4415 family)